MGNYYLGFQRFLQGIFLLFFFLHFYPLLTMFTGSLLTLLPNRIYELCQEVLVFLGLCLTCTGPNSCGDLGYKHFNSCLLLPFAKENKIPSFGWATAVHRSGQQTHFICFLATINSELEHLKYVLDYTGTLLGVCGWTRKFFGDCSAFVTSLLQVSCEKIGRHESSFLIVDRIRFELMPVVVTRLKCICLAGAFPMKVERQR